MIIKKLLAEWHRTINEDLQGVPVAQIAEGTGLNRQTVKNYMTLSNQEKFDEKVILKINEYRNKYFETAKALTKA
ncbi:hypothetical protein [Chitinophaga sp. CF418]|uniref:hypothetical protein n=1 Tax=Chitinophaga sp. CF418 TaxID=1855287 RepID=UPI00090F0389|nr:hypothetical protein [Chitinophaga sp. CF418]SHL87560.1 hypothetical protein SAMN05216311_1016 [Chitinophaga sp. CF418]